MPNVISREKTMRRRGRWLCGLGWTVFALSLSLPAFHVMDWTSGWDCFWIVIDIARDWIGGRSEGIGFGWGLYYSGFALMNLELIASPMFVWFFRHDLRRLRRIALTSAIATLYTASYWVVGACVGGLSAIGDLHVGYYAWVLSFGLVAAGALHLSIRRPNVCVNRRPSSLIRTEEELRAIRELEDYLRGFDQRPLQSEEDVERVPCKFIDHTDTAVEVSELPSERANLFASSAP